MVNIRFGVIVILLIMIITSILLIQQQRQLRLIQGDTMQYIVYYNGIFTNISTTQVQVKILFLHLMKC